MTNREVAAAFAEGREGAGRALRSEALPGDGHVLISYATPIAYRSARGEVFFDSRKYSATTSKQAALARRACGLEPGAAALPHEEFRRMLRLLGAAS